MSIESKKLQFGWYQVTLLKINADEPKETVLCKPLNQSDYMEGWQAVLPTKKPKSTVYNWNVNLAQLPPHLWHRCHMKYNKEGKSYYQRINDGIYTYNVSKTEHDDDMFKLYDMMNKSILDKSGINKLYETIKPHVSGWLLMRANKILYE